MNDNSPDISQELSGLGATLSELGASLRHASLRLLDEGVLPTESLVEQIVDIRSELRSVRARICRLAKDRGIAVPPVASLESIKAIETIFMQIKDMEMNRVKTRREIESARSIVEKVLSLRHDRLMEFAPLVACQERARAYRDGALSVSTEGEESGLAALEPFEGLLAVVEGRVGDEVGARDSLLRGVEEYFGRSLAMAASTGAIVVGQRTREGTPATRYQPVDGYRRVRTTSDLGIGTIEAPASKAFDDGFDNSSPWFSGLGRMPRMVLDDSFRPIVHETFFSPEPSARGIEVEASAAATTDINDPRGEGDESDFLDDAEKTAEQTPPVVAEEVQVTLKEARPRVIRGDSAQRASSSVGDFLIFRTDPFAGNRSRKLGNAVRRRSRPILEQLESIQLLSTCPAISGYVYLDKNNDGLYNYSDTPFGNNTIELFNAANQLVGTTTTDAQGAYSFNTDATLSTATKTEVKTSTITGTTNYIAPIDVPQFDPALGTLTRVKVEFTGELEATIQAENLSTSSGDSVTATLNGDVSMTGPGVSFDEPLTHAPLTANLTVFDGVSDFGGTSGVNFGKVAVTNSSLKTLSAAAGDDLSAFTGTGNYEGFVDSTALVKVMGGGNLDATTVSSTSATIQVTYEYTPMNCLSPGKYTVVQPALPPGTLNGHESANGVVLPYNPVLPNKIPVTLTNGNSINNNFGAILPAGLGGYVYVDNNKNGIKDTGEKTLPNVPIALTGLNDVGQSVQLSTTTDGNGSYIFTGLRPGDYTTMVTKQPAGYQAGQTTRGNVTPIPNSLGTNKIPDIVVPLGTFAPNNNFGELTPGTPAGESDHPTTVISVEREGIHHQMTTFIVHFQGGLVPSTANDVNNYHLYRLFNRKGASHREIPLKSAVYNPANNTVTLTPYHRLNVHYYYLLTISGVLSNTNPPQPIDGDNNGTPGGTYMTVITRSNYPHPLQGPGVIHQSLPARRGVAVRSANPGFASHHLVHKNVVGRGLSL